MFNLENYIQRKIKQNDQSLNLLKKRRRKEARKGPNLLANGRFQGGGQMEGSKLGGQWKVSSLVALKIIWYLVANGMVQA